MEGSIGNVQFRNDLDPDSAGGYHRQVHYERASNKCRGRRSHVDDKLVGELRDSIRRLEDRVSNLERAVTTAETERKYAL